MNASRLNGPVPTPTGNPVASALELPRAPVPPASDRLPKTVAVNGEPDCAVMKPLRVQFRTSLPCQPLAAKLLVVPLPGEENM